MTVNDYDLIKTLAEYRNGRPVFRRFEVQSECYWQRKRDCSRDGILFRVFEISGGFVQLQCLA